MEDRSPNRRKFIGQAAAGTAAAGLALAGMHCAPAVKTGKKRIMVGRYSDETNTFLPERWTLAEAKAAARYGKDAIPGGGFTHVCRMFDVELIGSISVGGNFRLMNKDVFDYVTGVMLDTLDKNQVDGVYLDLHGGCTAEAHDDMEGDVMALIRKKVGPNIPIMFSLDMHCDVTQQMAQNADAAYIGQKYPQYDGFEYRQAPGLMMMGRLFGKLKPVVAVKKLAMMIGPPMNVRSASYPIREVYARAREIERTVPGIIAVCPAHGYMQQDIPTQGSGVLAVADNGDRELAQKYADEVGELFFSHRKEFWVHLPDAAEAIQIAQKSTQPCIISDSGDNMGAGTPGDGTHFLRELLRLNVKSAIMQIHDKDAGLEAAQKGEGATVKLDVGGKSYPVYGPPVSVTGKVVKVMWDEKKVRPTVHMHVNDIELVVNPPRNLMTLGLDAHKYKMTIFKVGHEFGENYPEMDYQLIGADTPGFSTTNLNTFTWKRIPRPIYPLDDI